MTKKPEYLTTVTNLNDDDRWYFVHPHKDQITEFIDEANNCQNDESEESQDETCEDKNVDDEPDSPRLDIEQNNVHDIKKYELECPVSAVFDGPYLSDSFFLKHPNLPRDRCIGVFNNWQGTWGTHGSFNLLGTHGSFNL